MFAITGRNAVIFVAWLLASPAAAQTAHEDIAASKNFKLFCRDATECGRSVAPEVAATAPRILELMEDAQSWLQELGFPVERSNLTKRSGLKALVIQPTSPGAGECGDPEANACYGNDKTGLHWIFLPQAKLSDIADAPGTLAHEFIHSLEPEASSGELRWMSEAVATAVGTMFDVRHGGDMGIYQPKYLMSLDQPFYEAIDPGYGNWAYLLGVGQRLGSRDNVAYLAEDGFISIAEGAEGASASQGMRPLYDNALVGTATFDAVFPGFVATFNNVERATEPQDSTYHYYTDIERHDFRIPSTAEPVVKVYTGTVQTYAVAPILMPLDVTPQPEVEPRDMLMMADIELVTGNPLDTLSLVIEHKRADERHAETLMLDGSSAPEELGFLRIVNAPGEPSGEAEANAFELRVSARPIGFHPPACFQAGEPAELETAGFAPEDGENWRLITDNGSVDGVTVTPARPGPMTLEVEIDSPITRPESGLTPREPAKSRVELGQFDVISDDCMVRLRMGEATLTYTADGSYTEFRGPGGQALYFSAADMAAHEGGSWMPIPPIGKEMLLRRLASRNPAMKALGVGGEGELFFARMPLAFSERFSRGNLRETVGPAGGPPEHRSAACPDGTSGCTETTFLMDGHRVPVMHDAQGRPLMVTFSGEAMEFDYGTWPIRRPPGW